MPVTYDPKDASNVLPEGEYDAELVSVRDKISKTSGNEMQEWTLKIYSPSGKESTVFDYMVPPKGVYKLSQLSKAVGKHDEFKAGQFQADNCVGVPIRVMLDIEEGGKFEDKNRVVKYLPTAGTATLAQAASDAGPIRKPTTQARTQPATATAAGGGHQAVTEDDIPF